MIHQKNKNLSAVAPSPSEFGAPSNFMEDGFGTQHFPSSGDPMSNFGQSPRSRSSK